MFSHCICGHPSLEVKHACGPPPPPLLLLPRAKSLVEASIPVDFMDSDTQQQRDGGGGGERRLGQAGSSSSSSSGFTGRARAGGDRDFAPAMQRASLAPNALGLNVG